MVEVVVVEAMTAKTPHHRHILPRPLSQSQLTAQTKHPATRETLATPTGPGVLASGLGLQPAQQARILLVVGLAIEIKLEGISMIRLSKKRRVGSVARGTQRRQGPHQGKTPRAGLAEVGMQSRRRREATALVQVAVQVAGEGRVQRAVVDMNLLVSGAQVGGELDA